MKQKPDAAIDPIVVPPAAIPDFERLLEHMPMPAAIQDEQFRLVYVNRAFCDLLGYARDELIGASPTFLTDPEDLPRLRQVRKLMQELADGGCIVEERRGRRKDGRTFSGRIRTQRFAGTSETIGCFLSLAENIDQTVARERTLLGQVELYKLLFHDSAVPQSIQNEHWRIIEVNDAFCRFTGYSRDELIGRDPLESFAWLDAQEMLRHRSTFCRGQEQSYIGRGRRLQHRDGSQRRFNMFGRQVFTPEGKVVMFSSLIDVTEELALGERLERSLKQHRTLLDTTSAGVAHMIDHEVIHINPALERLLGWPLHELIGKDPFALFAGTREEWDTFKLAAMNVMARGETFRCETELRTRDGQIRLCELQCRQIEEASLAPGVIVTIHDITVLRQLEQERLRQALQQRDTLVREVHHRIKNNLQGVAGLLHQTGQARPDVAEVLNGVAARITTLAEVYGLQVRDGDALPVGRVVKSIAESLARMTGTPIRLTLPEGGITPHMALPETEAVPIALLINELLTNAIKHRTGSSVVQVELFDSGDAVCFSVSNAGVLPADFRLEDHAHGTSGLGLALAMRPRRGAELGLRAQDGLVTARLLLQSPVLRVLRSEPAPAHKVSDAAVR